VSDSKPQVIDEIKKPDAYWLTPCPIPVFPESESLEDFLKAFDDLAIKYADCRKRHSGLAQQCGK
jgi:hypothetical protein